MERKQLKKEIRKLLGDYIGTKLRENAFDPKGRRQYAFLDEMAHYDLAIGVALLWLNDSENQTSPEDEQGKLPFLSNHNYPNKMEREAMILSSFAGILMNSIPVEEVLGIYSCKPQVTHLKDSSKGLRKQPFNLSLHPFAMLTAPQAAKHIWKYDLRLQKAVQNKNMIGSSTTSSSGNDREGTKTSSDGEIAEQDSVGNLHDQKNIAEDPETGEEAAEQL
ncbi:uncharacterized protein C2orf80 homolog [Pleurodeles waltl]|uniref:uncharacterized protein C2orf80 homolog n=1 Tax=Pleurodeles waltl TaxID=8319 RepID=UPI0037093FDF